MLALCLAKTLDPGNFEILIFSLVQNNIYIFFICFLKYLF
jgi:hypothetical protein